MKLPTFDTILQAYQNVPSLQCTGCKGECCVSPTMTAAEFAIMMCYLMEKPTEQNWIDMLNRPSVEHEHWHGNSYCRFQDRTTGYCLVYSNRALACRLHGHDALKAYETPESVFCDLNPDVNHELDMPLLEKLLLPVQTEVGIFGSPYEAPFYFVSMNLECWLDFYFHPELAAGRPQLEKTWMDLRRIIKIDNVSGLVRTTLGGKLNLIEKAFQAVLEENFSEAILSFQSLQTDFPSVGTYFLEEAKLWENECRQMLDSMESANMTKS